MTNFPTFDATCTAQAEWFGSWYERLIYRAVLGREFPVSINTAARGVSLALPWGGPDARIAALDLRDTFHMRASGAVEREGEVVLSAANGSERHMSFVDAFEGSDAEATREFAARTLDVCAANQPDKGSAMRATSKLLRGLNIPKG